MKYNHRLIAVIKVLWNVIKFLKYSRHGCAVVHLVVQLCYPIFRIVHFNSAGSAVAKPWLDSLHSLSILDRGWSLFLLQSGQTTAGAQPISWSHFFFFSSIAAVLQPVSSHGFFSCSSTALLHSTATRSPSWCCLPISVVFFPDVFFHGIFHPVLFSVL